jgi:protein-tyrosine-phosphatase/tRNA A37 threonylcarbamoyladenosine synthetase subunit TsaC/SUA5/YrdC
MTKILDWRRSDDPRDIVHLAVQALAEGHVVALPSSTSYLLVASGLKKQAIQQLKQTVGPGNLGLSLMVRSADETLDYFPDIGTAARRFAKKAWPGPIMLSLKDSHASSVLKCLDPEVRAALNSKSERIRVWQPYHEVLDHVCKLSSGPLICSPAAAMRGRIVENIKNLAANQCVLAIDDGDVESPGEPTVVQIDGNQGRIVHHGIADENALRTISRWMVLFVCTGNTCRSPMAQAMMQQKIEERFPDASSGAVASVVACSAGISAFGGDPASHGAAAAIRKFGGSLEQHQSTQLNSNLVEQADLILAMGGRHCQVIASQWPSVSHKVHLISPDGSEISDPFGGPLEVYQKCAEQLNQHTSYWIERLDVDSLIQWQPSNESNPKEFGA